jgi:hypothetical protein
MPVANVIRISILGDLPSGEKWSVNPVWQIGGVSTAEDISPAEALTMATAVAAVTVPTGLLNVMSTTTRVLGCRLEARRWDGTLAAQAEALKATPTVGSGSQANPFQTSIVSSLRTGGTGGSSRGRLYWPATGIGIVATNLRPTGGNVSSALTGVKTYLTSITAAITPTLTNAPILSVWSRLGAATLPVSSILMGDVLDTQRRRRDTLVESYNSVAWP